MNVGFAKFQNTKDPAYERVFRPMKVVSRRSPDAISIPWSLEK
jgi:hypothetical protein